MWVGSTKISSLVCEISEVVSGILRCQSIQVERSSRQLQMWDWREGGRKFWDIKVLIIKFHGQMELKAMVFDESIACWRTDPWRT